MLVHEVMSSEPVVVHAATAVKSALAVLARHEVTTLPVVDGRGRLVGIVSEADLIREMVAADPRAHMVPVGGSERGPALQRPASVGEVMTPQVLTAHRQGDLAVAVDLLTSTGAKSLPVVDDHGQVVGILSRSDVVRVLARPDDVLERELDAQVVSLGHTDWTVQVEQGVAQVSGPGTRGERALAELAAHSVLGVTDVRVG